MSIIRFIRKGRVEKKRSALPIVPEENRNEEEDSSFPQTTLATTVPMRNNSQASVECVLFLSIPEKSTKQTSSDNESLEE